MHPRISKEQLVQVVSVILRVPALFIAEAWYRTDIKHVSDVNSLQFQYVKGQLQQVQQIDRTSYELILKTIYYGAILLAMVLVFLPLKKLVNFYMYLVSAGLFIASHYLSFLYVEEERKLDAVDPVYEDATSIQRLGFNLAAQGILSAVIAHLINLKHWTKITLLIYTTPMVARLFNYPVSDLHRVHNFATVFAILVVVFYICNHIPLVLDTLKSGINKLSVAVQLYGWIPFLVAMWFKIMLPMQFLIFWLVLFGLQLYKYFSVTNHPIFAEGWLVLLLASIGECCVTPISLMGTCITVSYISFLILTVTKLLLQGRDAFMNDNIMQRGWTEGFTMFLLAIQTGLVELKPPQRAFLMSIVLFIVVSSLIQSMYEIADPVLLALGASQNRRLYKHVRAIILCTILWMAPLYMTYIITQFFDLDFWLMVVVSSCILTSVQVIGSMVVYALFIYDGIHDNSWENLDDVVYYAKATTRVLEFIVAVFVVCYGVKESILGEWSWINTSILIVHCYFNVWQRLQAGWKSYLLRRDAVKKIESLPTATTEQLAEYNDVCAICFQDLKNARITPCNHFFHGLCLRKWLYVQENCPMCHQKIDMKDEEITENETEEVQTAAAHFNNAQHAPPIYNTGTPVQNENFSQDNSIQTDSKKESIPQTFQCHNGQGDGSELLPKSYSENLEATKTERPATR